MQKDMKRRHASAERNGRAKRTLIWVMSRSLCNFIRCFIVFSDLTIQLLNAKVSRFQVSGTIVCRVGYQFQYNFRWTNKGGRLTYVTGTQSSSSTDDIAGLEYYLIVLSCNLHLAAGLHSKPDHEILRV